MTRRLARVAAWAAGGLALGLFLASSMGDDPDRGVFVAMIVVMAVAFGEFFAWQDRRERREDEQMFAAGEDIRRAELAVGWLDEIDRGRRVELNRARGPRILLYAVGVVALGAIGVAMGRDGEWIGWIIAALSPIGLFLVLANAFMGWGVITIDGEGVSSRHGGRRAAIAWSQAKHVRPRTMSHRGIRTVRMVEIRGRDDQSIMITCSRRNYDDVVALAIELVERASR